MRIAIKTLAAIDAALEADNGAKFKMLEAETLPQCVDSYKPETFPFRTHLGSIPALISK